MQMNACRMIDRLEKLLTGEDTITIHNFHPLSQSACAAWPPSAIARTLLERTGAAGRITVKA